MTEFAEFEGKNIDKALEKASQALNLAVDQLRYDVVSYGSSGIFGLVGVKKAKIRVTIEGRIVSTQIEKEAKAEARNLVRDTFEDIEDDGPDAAQEQVIANGQKALQCLVDFISEGSRVESERKNGRILYKVGGGDSALLIGKRGQTLEALQYLIEKIVNKQNDTRIRVLVDVEGYLEVRKSNLQRLASKMADKAQRLNKPVTIGQMNAYDRRIVHLHLKDNPAVRTQSIGEGYYRKLVIFPKKRRRNKT
jgi:spoIIIJ-associated protein